jgi:site-specific DNA-methyltransferase (adenine-specific)
MNQIIHGDCLAILKKMADKSVDLVITDPPYGIQEHGGKLRHGPLSTKKGFAKKQYANLGWDKTAPGAEYFSEIFRVSKNQIIFGMNYFTEFLPPTKGFVVWHKKGTDGSSFADCELIYTSFDTAAKLFKYDWVGFGYINNPDKERKQHPTQKPQRLMRYLVERFSKEGDLILDPFAGSGSTCVAAQHLNRNYIGIEREQTYVEIAEARLAESHRQLTLTA